MYHPKSVTIPEDSALLYTGLGVSRDQDGVRLGKERDLLQKHLNIRTPVIVWYDFIIDNHFYIYTASIWVDNLYKITYLGTCGYEALKVAHSTNHRPRYIANASSSTQTWRPEVTVLHFYIIFWLLCGNVKMQIKTDYLIG